MAPLSRRQRRARKAAAGDARRRDEIAAAVEHHQAGRLDEAEALYRRVLDEASDHAETLHLLGILRHQRDDHEEALRRLNEAIAIDDGQAAYHHNLGEVYRALDRTAEAALSYRRAIALDGGYADAHFGLGNALLAEGDAAAAVKSYRQALYHAPRDVEVLLNLGNALAAGGEPDEAVTCYRRAVALAPGYAEAHVNLGEALAEKGALDEALASLRHAVTLAPDLAAAHLHLARTLEEKGDLEAAEASYRRALQAAPDDAGAWYRLGNCLKKQARLEAAIEGYRRALGIEPEFVAALINLGNALQESGALDEAIARCREVLDIEPRHPEALHNMAIALRQRGDFAEARQALERALEIRPDFSDALAALAAIRSHGADDPAIGRMERLLAGDGLEERERAELSFALGKAYDDVGRYDDAFERYVQGNALRHRDIRIDGAAEEADQVRLISVFEKAFFTERKGWGDATDLPVFIVGMPRSGTTLVEQILASHPRVFGAGELRTMHEIAEHLATRLGGTAPYPECAGAMDDRTARTLAGDYLQVLRDLSSDAARITDKMPDNFERLGLIALALPRARIIHCRRDPLDTCLSCFFQDFASRYPFAYDLADLGAHYRRYEALMDHWRAVLPSPMIEIDYESLVADLEGTSRRMVDFLGLEWDPRCLTFHETRRRVRTASEWQVRQPLFTSSVGRWRHYEGHLGPLKAALGDLRDDEPGRFD